MLKKPFLLQFNCSTPGLAFTLTNVVFIYSLFFHQLACQYLLVEMCQLLDLITTNCKLKTHVQALWVLLVIITVDCKRRHFSSCEKNSDRQNNKIMNTVASHADQLLRWSDWSCSVFQWEPQVLLFLPCVTHRTPPNTVKQDKTPHAIRTSWLYPWISSSSAAKPDLNLGHFEAQLMP